MLCQNLSKATTLIPSSDVQDVCVMFPEAKVFGTIGSAVSVDNWKKINKDWRRLTCRVEIFILDLMETENMHFWEIFILILTQKLNLDLKRVNFQTP